MLRMSSPKQMGAVNSMIHSGPMTIVLVFSTTCPHCHTYMPLWDELAQTKDKRANMISMEADTYQQTPLSAAKPVTSVPTVLFVDKEGQISEAEEPRNMTVMSNAVRYGVPEPEAAKIPATPPSSLFASPVPGTMISENPLPVLPGSVSPSQLGGHRHNQQGGNPWAAFMMAARQAAPAALLLGAYSQIRKPRRSSGLPAISRKTRRRRASRRS